MEENERYENVNTWANFHEPHHIRMNLSEIQLENNPLKLSRFSTERNQLQFTIDKFQRISYCFYGFHSDSIGIERSNWVWVTIWWFNEFLVPITHHQLCHRLFCRCRLCHNTIMYQILFFFLSHSIAIVNLIWMVAFFDYPFEQWENDCTT